MKDVFINKNGIIVPPHLKEQTKLAPVVLSFFRSVNPDLPPDQWEPVKFAEVPEWVKTEKMAAVLNMGHCVFDEERGPYWWGAKRLLPDPKMAGAEVH